MMKNTYASRAFRLLSVVLAAVLAASCGSQLQNINEYASAQEHSGTVLRIAVDALPDTLNPHTADAAQLEILRLLNGSLVEIDPESPANAPRFIGALADGLPAVSADGLTWTFRIREGLRFGDGTPIDARVFEYAVRMLLDPALNNPQAQDLLGAVRLAGAAAYADGRDVKWEDVGVKSPNRLTLQFVLDAPAPNPVALQAFNMVLVNPVIYEAGMNQGRTQTDYMPFSQILDYPSSGPYVAVEYEPGRLLVLEKNVSYPNAYKYDIERIEYHVTQGSAAEHNAAGYGDGSVYGAEAVQRDLTGDPWYIYINTNHPVLRDENLRKALYWGVDREQIVSELFPAFTPTAVFTALGALAGDPLSKEGMYLFWESDAAAGIRPQNGGRDASLALEYFEKAYNDNGGKKITLTITCFAESEYWGVMAIYIRDRWMTLFGADRFHLLLELVPMDEAYAAYESGDFELGFGASTQDIMNPWGSMIVWTSGYPNKTDGYFNKIFDELQYRGAYGSLMTDYAAKAELLAEMESMLQDFVPAIPLFQSTGAYLTR